MAGEGEVIMYPKFDCAIIVQLLCNYAGRDSKLHNAKIVGMERIETWEFPIDAIREGITNKMNVMMQK